MTQDSPDSSDRFGGALRLDLPAPKVVLSYGMGVDSTAILLRWLYEPTSRNFDIADLAIVTAQTGDEWPQTGAIVAQYVLPLLREHGVRFIECARRTGSTTDGVLVFQDTDCPEGLNIGGEYKLSDELLLSGTVPQTGGARLCSAKSKGWALDEVIGAITHDQPYRHVVGFESEEVKRAERDATYNTALRTGEYPLLRAHWDWDREMCERYIEQVTGVYPWPKSACTMCPFALTNKAGRKRTIARYAAEPEHGIFALSMEHLAVALNRKQGLIAGDRLYDAIAEAGHADLLRAFHRHLDGTRHALYEVRRVMRGRKDDPTKMANAARSLQILETGSRDALIERLHIEASLRDAQIEEDFPITRAWLQERALTFPSREHFLVVAPVGAVEKENPHFATWWQETEAYWAAA